MRAGSSIADKGQTEDRGSLVLAANPDKGKAKEVV
jgi:hypothetical protein